MKKIYKNIILILLFLIILFQNASVYAESNLVVAAKASIIVETNTGKVIYENNSDIKNYPASVTKVLTAILVIENCKMDDVAIASYTAISKVPSGYVVAPLSVGEKMKIKDLLYALMLKSANDAAYVLAEHVGGSIDGFSDMMNKKAKELGCENSHFVNPNGIHAKNHYTSAYDMYLISSYAMKNDTFRKIVSTYKYTLPATNKYKYKNRVMTNSNAFVNPNSSLYNKDIHGIKTGTTKQAGNCLITESSKDGLEFVTVVLGAKTKYSKFSETEKMIKYAFDNYTYTTLHESGDIIKSVEVEKATKETKNLDVEIADEIIVFNNKNVNLDDIVPEISLREGIIAPIKKGEELGTVKYTLEDIEYTAKLIAANDVEKRVYYKEISISICAILAVIILIIVVLRRARKKNRRKSKHLA